MQPTFYVYTWMYMNIYILPAKQTRPQISLFTHTHTYIGAEQQPLAFLYVGQSHAKLYWFFFSAVCLAVCRRGKKTHY